ncbi:E3 ubiquitin-protein ligase NEURL1B [Camelus dromedarius]|uniref:RING-type E3 ubiquitin transferase n=1 Tax=Camelus dromedarius TaxID=9838 RepID=A0A5N4CML5_CAMDR|nr:E3 ubiquitin-protein ligase NEURL1B [Camelus dromedarius]
MGFESGPNPPARLCPSADSSPPARLLATRPCCGPGPERRPVLGEAPRFHTQAKGKNVRLDGHSRRATRRNSFCNGVTFTQRPIRLYEQVRLRLVAVRPGWSGALRFGFTAHDPSLMSAQDIPKYACPDLVTRPGYWAKALPENLALRDTVLAYWADRHGRVFYSVNDGEPVLFHCGVAVGGPLWALIDVYGITDEVQLLETMPDGDKAPHIKGDPAFSDGLLCARERVRGHADARAPRPGPLQRLPAAQEPHAANFDNNELENNQVVAKLGHLALGRAPGPPRRTPTTRPPPSPRAPRLLLPASRRRCSGRPALPHDAGPRREPVVDPLPARPPTPYLVSPDARCGPGRASRGGGPPGLAARRWLSASRRATRARCGPPSCPPTPRRAARPKGVLGGGARRPVRAAATAPAITLRPGGDVLLGVKGARAPACFAWTPRRRSGLLLRPARGAAGQLRLLGTLQSSPATTSPSGSLSGSQDDSDSDMAFSVNQSSSASESSLVTAPSSPLSPPVSPVFPPPELAGSKNGECTVCFDGEVDTVIYTCGHMCLCYSCGLRLKRQARACCPICRRPIKDVIKIYRP